MVLLDKLKGRWLQAVVHVGALLPLAWILWDYTQGSFFIDPVKEITARTGSVGLILLLLSLAATPINTLFAFRQVLRARRALGLYAFLYVGLHFLTFALLDYRLDFETLVPAIYSQRYVLVGFAAGLILLALAVTSTKGWQRRLGRTWKKLHRLVYLAGFLAILHYLWLVKDIGEPVRYGIILIALLVLRIPSVRKAVSSIRYQLRRWRPTQRRATRHTDLA
jgi:sulfoxide reductase heme-binding subunit YedZ